MAKKSQRAAVPEAMPAGVAPVVQAMAPASVAKSGRTVEDILMKFGNVVQTLSKELVQGLQLVRNAALATAAPLLALTRTALQLSQEGDLLRRSYQRLAISVGNIFAPAVRNLSSIIDSLANTINGLDPSVKKTIANVGVVAVAIATVATGLLAILAPLTAVVGGFTAAIGGLALIVGGPLALAVGAIAIGLGSMGALFLAIVFKMNGFQGSIDLVIDGMITLAQVIAFLVRTIDNNISNMAKGADFLKKANDGAQAAIKFALITVPQKFNPMDLGELIKPNKAKSGKQEEPEGRKAIKDILNNLTTGLMKLTPKLTIESVQGSYDRMQLDAINYTDPVLKESQEIAKNTAGTWEALRTLARIFGGIDIGAAK